MTSLLPTAQPQQQDRELYVMRTKLGNTHLIEVVPVEPGRYQMYMNGNVMGAGTYYNETVLEARLKFFERGAAPECWKELQPEEAVLIAEDLLCP